jgi:hypothetical protein
MSNTPRTFFFLQFLRKRLRRNEQRTRLTGGTTGSRRSIPHEKTGHFNLLKALFLVHARKAKTWDFILAIDSTHLQ